MPLLGHEHLEASPIIGHDSESEKPLARAEPVRRQSQHSTIAKTAIMSSFVNPTFDTTHSPELKTSNSSSLKSSEGGLAAAQSRPQHNTGLGGACLTDTPATTAPNSPRM